jgi:4-carboxymuconolactone decarboxylase
MSERSQVHGSAADVFDEIVASRGQMLRPFEVLLYVPEVARHAGALGATLRYASVLSDHDRELAIVATAFQHACGFELEVHEPLARAAGVRDETIAHLRDGRGDLTPDEAAIVEVAVELCATSRVSDRAFGAARDRLGDAGVIELAALVGYYTMLAFAMNAVEAG